MRGGMTFFKGSSSDAARRYLEKDRTTASEYYLENGRVLATNYSFGTDGNLTNTTLLTGESYQALMDGKDPETGAQRGRKTTDKSLRFIDKIINVSKDLSLAAELDDEISEALDQAMSQASMGLGAYLAKNAHVRIMVDGEMAWVSPDEIQVATVVHRTSRDGDPHRHIHFQIVNKARFGSKWYAFDTQELRGLNRALNMLGERVIHSDANLLRVMEEKGYSFDPATGDVAELNPYSDVFSQRAHAIAERRAELIEAWEAAHPGEELGQDMLNILDHQAWAQTRAAKPTETYADAMSWREELAGLGFTAPTAGIAKRHGEVSQVSEQMREDYALSVVAQLGARSSSWSRADMTATIYERLGKYQLVGSPQELAVFAEDVLARAENLCTGVLHDGDPRTLPAFIKGYTSDAVLVDEAKIRAQFVEMGATHAPVKMFRQGKISRLDGALSVEDIRDFFQSYQVLHPEQKVLLPSSAEHWEALCHAAGSARLTGVIGPAGAGKTTLLSALKVLTEAQGGSLHVVAPSGKAAMGAQEETGAHGSTLHKLLMSYGFSFETDEETGVTTWDERDRSQPVPAEWLLSANDVLVIDEAGMVTQDVAVRVNEIVRETGVRLRAVGDYRQLAAVGRGGVLEMVREHAQSTDLRDIYRFKTADGEQDKAYAELSLQIRLGEDPRAVFDALVERGLIVLHQDEEEAHEALAEAWVASHEAGESCVIATATNADVTSINRLTAQARQNLEIQGWSENPEDTDVLTGRDALAIHVGDIISTRQNSAELDVLNRQTWVVKSIADTHILVESTEDKAHRVTLPLEYVGEHVEFAYAITGHGSQGMTVDQAHVLVTDATDAAGLYVGASRGRFANRVHFVAEDMDKAYEQFASALRRDNADRGLAPARVALLNQLEEMGFAPEKPAVFRTPIRVCDVKPGQLLQGKSLVTVLGTRQEDGGASRLLVRSEDTRKTFWTKPLSAETVVGYYRGMNTDIPLSKPAKQELAQLKKKYQVMCSAAEYVEQVKSWRQGHLGDFEMMDHSARFVEGAQRNLVGAEDKLARAQSVYADAVEAREKFLAEPRRELAEAREAWDRAGGFARTFGRVFARLDKAQENLDKAQEKAVMPSPAAVEACQEYVDRLVALRDGNQRFIDEKRAELRESMPIRPAGSGEYMQGSAKSSSGVLRLVDGFEAEMSIVSARMGQVASADPGVRAEGWGRYHREQEAAVVRRSAARASAKGHGTDFYTYRASGVRGRDYGPEM